MAAEGSSSSSFSLTNQPKETFIAYNEMNQPVHTTLSGGAEILAGYNGGGYRILKELKGQSWEYHLRDAARTLAVVRNDTLQYFTLYGGDMIGQIETPGGTLRLGSGHRYFLKDHLGSIRQVVDATGASQSTTDYYPFGLTMPGRSTTTGTTIEKFTGHERDDEANLNIYHMNARGMDPVLGRMMQVDRRHDKYPGISPYAYVANNPIGFTDMTGDTIDIAPELLRPIVYGAEHERAGEAKDYGDYTEADHHREEFQNMWSAYGEQLTVLFGKDGKYGTTNLNFVFSPMKRPSGSGFRRDAGLTAYGKQGTDRNRFNLSKTMTTIDFSPGQAQIDIYLNPNNAQGQSLNTSSHEVQHAALIFIDMLYGGTVRDFNWQHKQIDTHKASLRRLLPGLLGGN